MNEFYQEVKKCLAQGKEAVLATIISSSGSTPRKAGSQMFVKADGSIRGSVGGGAVEYQAINAALETMEKKKSCRKEFSLTRQQAGDIGMVCGGRTTIYFQYLSPQNREFLQVWDRLLKALERREEGWLLLDITGEESWKMEIYIREKGEGPDAFGKQGGFVSRHKQPGTMPERMPEAAPERMPEAALQILPETGGQGVLWEEGGRTCFIQPIGLAGKAYIFGAGHVARELVPVLSHVGFSCVVMDDREEFANPRMFPEAEQIVVGDLERIGDYVSIKEKDYVCIMTRGHQYDYLVQKQVMPLHPCYIGVMGSKNKIRVVWEKLMEDGFSKEELEFCHMPIGTAILAETPAEIAISIAGELIQVRALRTGKKRAN